uniref:Uncharacterized protein n=1 Tax=Oryza meridionalis TaxID=40149 RepID=A0A0E0DL59_9ORYZ
MRRRTCCRRQCTSAWSPSPSQQLMGPVAIRHPQAAAQDDGPTHGGRDGAVGVRARADSHRSGGAAALDDGDSARHDGRDGALRVGYERISADLAAAVVPWRIFFPPMTREILLLRMMRCPKRPTPQLGVAP